MASRGKFIVLEGIDGCGKSTIALRLAARLRSASSTRVLITKEPTCTSAAGKKIHAILRHREPAPTPAELQKLYIADRKAHIANVIRPALAAGKTVICQRYAMSTYAYGMAFGVSRRQLAHRFLKPDLTILLDLSAAEAMRRIAGRGRSKEYFEKQEELEKVRKEYLKLARNKEFGRVIVLDARSVPRVLISQVDTILARGR